VSNAFFSSNIYTKKLQQNVSVCTQLKLTRFQENWK